MRLVQPSVAGWVETAEHGLDARVEPGRVPAPEEEHDQEQHRDREEEDGHRPARALAEPVAHPRQEDDRRQREPERRLDVVHEMERAANLVGVVDRQHVLAEDRRHHLHHEHDQERGDDAGELPPHVRARAQSGRVQDLAHSQVVVVHDGGARTDGDE